MNTREESQDTQDVLPPPQAKWNDRVSKDYLLQHIIGSGGSGDVWLAKHKHTGNAIAVKIMHNGETTIRASHAQYISDILRLSSSPNASIFCFTLGAAEHLGRQCILFELYGISIRGLLNKSYMLPLPTFQSRAILWQVCNAIAFLHDIQIVHTDIKPENIVLVNEAFTMVKHISALGQFFDKRILKDTQIKIIDLEDSVIRPTSSQHINGTAGYHAPEIYGKSGWGYPVDVFAIGCLTFELYTGAPLIPWVEDTQEYFYCVERCIRSFDRKQGIDINHNYPDMFRIGKKVAKLTFVKMDRKRRNRLSSFIADIMAEKRSLADNDVKQFISVCSEVDPNKRLTAKSTLTQNIFSSFVKTNRK